jgi:DNA repair exonuclease SbcCD ATPase subunit
MSKANEAMGTCKHPCGHSINPSTPHIKEDECLYWQPLAPAEPTVARGRLCNEDHVRSSDGTCANCAYVFPAEPTAGILNNLAGVFGTWPGDETDEELLAKLKALDTTSEAECRQYIAELQASNKRWEQSWNYLDNFRKRLLLNLNAMTMQRNESQDKCHTAEAALAEMTKQCSKLGTRICEMERDTDHSLAALAEMTKQLEDANAAAEVAMQNFRGKIAAEAALATERNQWDKERYRDAIVVRDMVNQLATEHQAVTISAEEAWKKHSNHAGDMTLIEPREAYLAGFRTASRALATERQRVREAESHE